MDTLIFSVLKKHPLFKKLDENTLFTISSLFSIKSYGIGQYVFQQYDEADRLYIIISGQASIETVSLDGKIIIIAQLSTGHIFGEFALIDNHPRSASVLITHSARLASLSGYAFLKLMNEHPSISKAMLQTLVKHIRHSNDQIESLVNLSLLQRTAKLLLTMNRTEENVINVTQKKLSEQLFASREKVNAKLKELEEIGSIKRGHRKIEIISENRLSMLIN